MTAIIRRPVFDLRFVSEESEFHIIHDTSISLNNRFMTESVISMSTTNAMEDDSSAFSIVLAGDMEWSKILNANDMVIIKIKPNESTQEGKDEVRNDVVMIGLVTEVRLEGMYSDNTKMYRITGQSFAKAFMQFELNTVRQVTFPWAGGWLDNPNSDGDSNLYSQIAKSTVEDIVKALLDRFMQYMEYNFESNDTENTSLITRIRTEINSWTNDEMLLDPQPFLNFEGSFNQLLDEVVNRPFCEKFFDVWLSEEGNEKAKFVVRRTPFDEEDWKRLHRHELSSQDVITESVAHTDLDAYSIFNIFPESEITANTAAIVRPKYHPTLVKKYGYKMLEIPHKYISPIGTGDENRIEIYSRRLYNWYANNPNFYSGDIVIIGHPDYRLGNRLLYRDPEREDLWEYYIESVEHNFSYTDGFTTTLGVTRGLRLKDEHDDGFRFTPFVGEAEDFTGGLFGEASIGELIEAQEAHLRDARYEEDRAGLGNTANNSLFWPATGPITSKYGNRRHPTEGVWRMHNGTDIGGPVGRPIYATASGVVITAKNNPSGYGRYIEIDDGNLNGEGKVTSIYAHLSGFNVAVGDNVTVGQRIGSMGATGNVTGPHLHFEIKVNGSFVDPERFTNWKNK